MVSKRIERSEAIEFLSNAAGIDKSQTKAALMVVAKAMAEPDVKLKLRNAGTFTTYISDSVKIKTPRTNVTKPLKRVSVVFKQPKHARGDV